MTRAIDVAHYLIHKAAAEPEPEHLTHLRLQKLLFYSQAWCLAVHGRVLFDDRIEAWQHGPVVRSIYPQFADYGWEEIFPINNIPMPTHMSDEDKVLVESVWGSYKNYSASGLRELTHSEDPWRMARQGCDAFAPCEAEISAKSMAEFYSHKYTAHDRKIPGLELAELRAQRAAFDAGKGIPLKDALDRLGMSDALSDRTPRQGAGAACRNGT